MGKKTKALTVKKGNTDPEFKNCILIAASAIPPKLRLKLKPVHEAVADVTFWRFNTKKQKPVALLSMSPEGWHVGWDSCGVCGHYFTKCPCNAIAPDKGILYLTKRTEHWERISRQAAYAQWAKPEAKKLPPPPPSKPLPVPMPRKPLPPTPTPAVIPKKKLLPPPPQKKAKPLPPIKKKRLF